MFLIMQEALLASVLYINRIWPILGLGLAVADSPHVGLWSQAAGLSKAKQSKVAVMSLKPS